LPSTRLSRGRRALSCNPPPAQKALQAARPTARRRDEEKTHHVGYRRYARGATRRIRFIKRAQDLGFSLSEITDLLELRAHSPRACAGVERKARDKVVVVDAKIRELQRMRRALEILAADCAARAPFADCPILAALETE
jgi:MerR family mercuric resistance operon transcriptional regulator